MWPNIAPTARVIQRTVATDAQRIAGNTYNELSRDLQDQTFYDTLTFSTTLDRQSFFVDGIGKILPGTTITKTLAHTNVKGAGSRLPAGYQFLIKGLSINAQKRAWDQGETEVEFAAAVVRVLQASNFRIVFPGRDFDFETPGDAWLPTICATDSSTTATSVARTGDFLANKLLPLRNQIVIGSIGGAPVDFSVDWFVDRADSGVSTALNALAGGSTPDGIKFGLVGTLEKLK